jgi:uncharacterized tellurite resistance protein B-like protein
MTKNIYHEAVLFLTHLIVYADGELDENEVKAISQICDHESITPEYYDDFSIRIKGMHEREMYLQGIDLVSQCNDREKLDALAWLYQISEVDGKVHVKEVRFLLYSIKKAGIEFEDVIDKAKKMPRLLL